MGRARRVRKIPGAARGGLSSAGSTAGTARECARSVMEAVPVVMRVIRAEMRLRGGQFASVPQLRALGLVHRRPGASLTDVATHLGVTPATASVLVDRLVRRDLLHRDPHPRERRRITLSLTHNGSRHLREVRTATRRRLEQILASVPARDRVAISAGATLLRKVFMEDHDADGR
jgi:DNA-binding MarR family transcriptional regulator